MSQRDFSLPLMMNFLDGVILAANAISDVALVVDAPSCVSFKGERIYGNHDALSDLCRVDRLRLFSSNLTLTDLQMGREEKLIEMTRRAAAVPGLSRVLLTASAMVSVTGKQFVTIYDQLPQDAAKKVLEVPSRDLYADWLEGVTEVMTALVRELDFEPAEKTPKRTDVALIGYVMDRHEADQTANIAELRELLQAVGLNPVSVWLSGGTLAELKAAEKAGMILALPHGRKPARMLARKLGVDVVNLPMPVGLDETAAFLRALGEAFGCKPKAEKVIRAGERLVLPQLGWLMSHRVMHKRYAICADPALLPGMAQTYSMLGARAGVVASPARHVHADAAFKAALGEDVLFDPTVDSMLARIDAAEAADGPLDLIIGDSLLLSQVVARQTPTLEFGYPSYYTHYLTPMPYLGYAGVLGLVERFANAVGQNAMRRFEL